VRILVIDNNIDRNCWGSPELVRFGKLVPGATVHVRRAPEGDLPVSPAFFDRIIVSGSKTSAMDSSPWVLALHEFIRRALDMGKPYLGVCYGHQSLVRALGGSDTVRKGAVPEIGWTKVEIVEDPGKQQASLLAGLPREFYTFSSHFEEVSQLPAGMLRLAKSQDCEIQACQLEGRPVFGIQFHPEKNLAEAELSLEERKKSKTRVPLLFPEKSKQLYDPSVGEIIFRNFLNA
jgi:GMP synthase (glutamine-hydrolysing)